MDYSFMQVNSVVNAQKALSEESVNMYSIERSLAFLVPRMKEKLADVLQALIQERIHEHVVEPSWKRQKGKRGRDSEEELLEAAMARAPVLGEQAVFPVCCLFFEQFPFFFRKKTRVRT